MLPSYLLVLPKDRHQGCVAMTTGAFAGLWEVVSCGNKEKYICKKPAEGVRVTTVPPTTAPLSCEPGWNPLPNRNFCFKVGTEPRQMESGMYFQVHKSHVKTFLLATFFLLLKIYAKGEEQKRNWFEARDFCRAIGGDLLSLHSTSDLRRNEYVFSAASP